MLKSGVAQVNELQVQVDDAGRAICEEKALRSAVKRARQRADIMAELMRGKVVGISKARINSMVPPRSYAMNAMAAKGSVYQPGKVNCSVSVDLLFDVE